MLRFDTYSGLLLIEDISNENHRSQPPSSKPQTYCLRRWARAPAHVLAGECPRTEFLSNFYPSILHHLLKLYHDTVTGLWRTRERSRSDGSQHCTSGPLLGSGGWHPHGCAKQGPLAPGSPPGHPRPCWDSSFTASLHQKNHLRCLRGKHRCLEPPKSNEWGRTRESLHCGVWMLNKTCKWRSHACKVGKNKTSGSKPLVLGPVAVVLPGKLGLSDSRVSSWIQWTWTSKNRAQSPFKFALGVLLRHAAVWEPGVQSKRVTSGATRDSTSRSPVITPWISSRVSLFCKWLCSSWSRAFASPWSASLPLCAYFLELDLFPAQSRCSTN